MCKDGAHECEVYIRAHAWLHMHAGSLTGTGGWNAGRKLLALQKKILFASEISWLLNNDRQRDTRSLIHASFRTQAERSGRIVSVMEDIPILSLRCTDIGPPWPRDTLDGLFNLQRFARHC